MPNIYILVKSGYPSRNRLCFNGDESKFELCEVKFWGYMQIQKLYEMILAPFWSSQWQRLLWKEYRCICWMNSISWWSKFALIIRKTNPWWWENINCISVSHPNLKWKLCNNLHVTLLSNRMRYSLKQSQ